MNGGFSEEQDLSRIPSEVTTRVLKLDVRQHDIHQNLRSIGEEIAAFYMDGLRILHDGNLQTAASLLGHLAKEIDSGLKDLLPIKEDTKKIFKLLDGKGFAQPKQIALILAALNLDIDNLQSSTPLTNQDRVRIENHLRGRGLSLSKELASILITLNLDANNLPSPDVANRVDIAIRWIDVSIRFNDFDHDHGIGKPPRPLEEFMPLWETFEGVLANLVGSYLNFSSRIIDQILKHEVPTKEVKNSLPNMIKLEPLEAGPGYRYFFEHLPHRGWLEPLSNIGYFNPKYNPIPQEMSDQPGSYRIPVWHALEYVAQVAAQTKNRRSNQIVNTLVKIIDAIIDYTDDNGERIENDRTDLQVIKIIGTLPINLLERQHITFIEIALKSKWKYGLVDQEISQTILPKLLNGGKRGLTLALLAIMLEVASLEPDLRPVMNDYWLEAALKAQTQTIANLYGIEAAQIALENIRAIAIANRFILDFIQRVESDLSRLSHPNYPELVVSFTSALFRFTEPDNIEQMVQVLLQDPHAIIRRIAVKAITDHYSNLKHLFWGWEGNPLDEIELKPEMYELIQANGSTFNENEMEQVLQWIESTEN